MRVSPRGRAILHRIAAEDAVERLYRPGDFVLTCSRGTLARSMAVATASGVNHAALIVDSSGGLIEVNPFFVTAEGSLRRSHLCHYLERDAPVWVGYVELLDGTRSEVVRYAEQMLEEQQRFSEWQFAGLLLHMGMGIAPRSLTSKYRWLRPAHWLFDHHALVWKEENIFTSAELVARALERGGFVWDRDPAYITPAVLFERFCPPVRAQDMQPEVLSQAQVVGPGVLAPSGGARQVWLRGEAGAASSAEEQESGDELSSTPAPEPAPTSRVHHLQKQIAWGVCALVLGGALVALGLGWAARVLGGQAK